MTYDIGTISFAGTNSGDSFECMTNLSRGWSSPFTFLQSERDSPKTDITETSEISSVEYNDDEEKHQAVTRSISDSDLIRTCNFFTHRNLDRTEDMLVSFQQQSNNAAKTTTNDLSDTISWTEKSKTWLPTKHRNPSAMPEERILRERYQHLFKWSNYGTIKYCC